MTRLILLPLLALTAFLTACGESGEAGRVTSQPTPTDHWLLESEPPDAVSVTQAKASAQAGDDIVLRARIGGRMDPISDDSPVFTVMDLSVPHCGQIPGDTCPTPWDYCCEPRESVRAHAATVQVVDSAGNAPAISPAKAGLVPLDEVVIIGKVGPRPTSDVLTIKASAVYPVKRYYSGR